VAALKPGAHPAAFLRQLLEVLMEQYVQIPTNTTLVVFTTQRGGAQVQQFPQDSQRAHVAGAVECIILTGR
jgi:hypothetical protein